jgi:hypothetical protein
MTDSIKQKDESKDVRSDSRTDQIASVTLPLKQWNTILRLISIGTRHGEDSMLVVGGTLLQEVHDQLAPQVDPTKK